tara:strand:+ start:1230 stop:2222 length:993 start_codon:yes stop_codon:yes gene_type:complete
VIILIVGGITRLTYSGLSMVDWRPVMGILPPLSETDWEEVFAKYREIPQFKVYNPEMTVDEFKDIFFWEYLHRILGRLVGLLCLVPYLWFLWKKRLSGSMKGRGLGLVLLVGIQGLMGWYMVKSGLDPEGERVLVSHYRLAVHLALAFALFGLAWWMILDLGGGRERTGSFRGLRLWALGLLALLCLQVTYGAFISGSKAGYGFHTFPKMGDNWIPETLFGDRLSVWKNFFEYPVFIQFFHRWLGAFLTVATIGFGWVALRSSSLSAGQRRRIVWLMGLVATQFCLGVVTILFLREIDVLLPVLHQLAALALFAAFLACIHSFGKPSPEQ